MGTTDAVKIPCRLRPRSHDRNAQRRALSVHTYRLEQPVGSLTSSAFGASAVANPQEPTFLVIGDLSFFHDLNGLLAATLHHLNLTIILINNDGGGIFSFLPQAAYPEHFEQLFGTPIALDFQPVSQMYGAHYQRVANWEQFQKSLQRAMNEGHLHIIEVRTERSSNVRMHRHLWQVLDQELQKHLPERYLH